MQSAPLSEKKRRTSISLCEGPDLTTILSVIANKTSSSSYIQYFYAIIN